MILEVYASGGSGIEIFTGDSFAASGEERVDVYFIRITGTSSTFYDACEVCEIKCL